MIDRAEEMTDGVSIYLLPFLNGNRTEQTRARKQPIGHG